MKRLRTHYTNFQWTLEKWKIELFDIKVRKEITIAPIRDYIENWLKNALTKIMELDQEEVVATSHKIPAKIHYKRQPQTSR
jgi:hypothetical protein